MYWYSDTGTLYIIYRYIILAMTLQGVNDNDPKSNWKLYYIPITYDIRNLCLIYENLLTSNKLKKIWLVENYLYF